MKGLDYFQKAIERDPLYALAYSGLADAYAVLGAWESGAMAPRELSGTDLSPQLARLSDSPPEGSDWLHEIKFDGYRALCWLRRGRARIFTRSSKDWTDRRKPPTGCRGWGSRRGCRWASA